MDFDIENFVNGTITGEILPKEVEKTFDEKGPLLILKYPIYQVAIHIHFNDDGEFENTGRAHIKSYHPKNEIMYPRLIDAREVALIRMHLELEEKSKRGNLNRDKIIQNVSNILFKYKLQKIEQNNSDLILAFTRNFALGGPIIFLIYEINDKKPTINELIKSARTWSKINTGKFITNGFLNIIILHNGELLKSDIDGKVSLKSINTRFLQFRSITCINKTNNLIIQDCKIVSKYERNSKIVLELKKMNDLNSDK